MRGEIGLGNRYGWSRHPRTAGGVEKLGSAVGRTQSHCGGGRLRSVAVADQNQHVAAGHGKLAHIKFCARLRKLDRIA